LVANKTFTAGCLKENPARRQPLPAFKVYRATRDKASVRDYSNPYHGYPAFLR